MEAKPYPEAKRRILIERSVEDIIAFLDEVTDTKGREFIRTQLLPRTVTGFRPGHAPLTLTVPKLISNLSDERELTKPDSRIWDMFNNVWRCWVGSHQALNDILLEFDNKADFDDNEMCITPPNSELDRQCFQVLLEASLNNKIYQETIRRFYEYGYFNQCNQIEDIINEARPREEIERRQQIEQIPEQVDRLHQEIEELRTQISNLEPISELQQVLDQREIEIQQTFENQLAQLNVSENVSQLNLLIESLNSRISEVETYLKTQIETLENSQTETDSGINDFVEHIEGIIRQLEQKIEDTDQSVTEKFEQTNSAIRDITERLDSMDSTIAEIKIMVEEQNQTKVQRIARQAIEIGKRYESKLASDTGRYSNEEEYLEKMTTFQKKFGLTNLEEKDDSEEIAAAVHIAMKAFPALEITDDRLIKIWQLICGNHLHITKINVELGWLGPQDWFPNLFSEECFDKRLERDDLDISIQEMLKLGDMPWAIHLNNCDKSYPDSYLPSFLDWIKKTCGEGMKVFLTRCSGTNRCITSEDFYERVARLLKPNEQAPINVRHLEDIHVVTHSDWVSWCDTDTSASVSFEKQLTLLKKLQTIIENMEVQLPDKIVPDIGHYLQLSHNILTPTLALDWALTLRLLPWIENQPEIVDSIYNMSNGEEDELPHFNKGIQQAREKANESD